MKRMPRIAVIGAGRWGKHLIATCDRLGSLAMVFDRGNKKNRAWLAEHFPHVTATDSLDEIFSSPAIDAVVIATPIDSHAALVAAALEAGKHVFVEKPITTDPSAARSLAARARKKKLVLGVGHVFVYHPICDKLAAIIAREGWAYARFEWSKLGTFGEDILWNLGSHDVALAHYLFGKPRSGSVIASQSGVSAADIMHIQLAWAGGRTCDIVHNRVSQQKHKTVTLITQRGTILVWSDNTLARYDARMSEWKPVATTDKKSLDIECADFLTSIAKKRAPRVDGAFGAAVVATIATLRQ